jgi:ADP-ribose pyrophosphatase YjhB (NUDIX family)
MGVRRSDHVEPDWLAWARRLNALAQTGLNFAADPYDIERYTAIHKIAAEMIAHGAGADTEQVLSLLLSDTGYATPKVDVRGVVFRDGKILLVQERSDGLWTLPGGWADVGDSPDDAVVREVREESGFETRATKLLALLDRNRHGHPPHVNHIYKVFFRCKIVGGSPVTSHEIMDVGFFAEDEIPDLSLTRIVPSQISRMFEHLRQPDLPADFD